MFFRRIDVSFEDRCVKSRSGDSRRETKELGFSLHRLADDDGTHAQARRQRAAATDISQTIAIGSALSDQAGQVANQCLAPSLWNRPFNFSHEPYEETLRWILKN